MSGAIWRPISLSPSQKMAWMTVALILGSIFVILGLLFREEAAGAIGVWIKSRTYNHCFLIFPMALYLLWSRRSQFAGATAEPALWGLGLVAGMSLLWGIIAILGVLEAQQFIVISIAQAVLLTIFGWKLYRRMILGFVYLYFLIPTGIFLIPLLQDFTASFAVHGLLLLGVPVYSNGTIIEVPSGTFQVAEACAGLRFLIATVALGVFYAFEIYQSIWRRCCFIGFCVVGPIMANGLRVLGIILLAQYLGSAAAAETDHVTYGFIFFSLVLAVLIYVGWLFSDRHSVDEGPKTDDVSADAAHESWWDIARPFAPIVGFSLLLAASGPIALALLDSQINMPLPNLAPRVSQPWRPAIASGVPWVPEIHDVGRSFQDVKSDGAHTVYRVVALYPAGSSRSKLIRSDDRLADEHKWSYVSSSHTRLRIEGSEIPVDSTVIESDGLRRLVLSFYVVDGRAVVSPLQVKIRRLQAYVSPNNCALGYFALAADVVGGDLPVEVLQEYVDAMERPSAYLCKS